MNHQMINVLLAADNKVSDYLLAVKVLLEPPLSDTFFFVRYEIHQDLGFLFDTIRY